MSLQEKKKTEQYFFYMACCHLTIYEHHKNFIGYIIFADLFSRTYILIII